MFFFLTLLPYLTKLVQACPNLSKLVHFLSHLSGSVREENLSTQDQYQANVLAFQREIKELTDQLCQKENFVKELVSSRDVLHQQLDDKTIRLEDFKKRLLAAENKRVDVEQENTGQLRRVKDCLSEINELQQKLQVSKN